MISDGRKGHEIQSETLAEHISQTTKTHRFNLKQPWESFAPRIIPGFKHGMNGYQGTGPEYSIKPQLIISTGRKAAAVAKFICQKLKKEHHHVKHIQILNPKDSFKNYDLLLLPEHDNKTGDNIVTFLGSIHPFDTNWFSQTKAPKTSQISLVIGNPSSAYFNKDFSTELNKIRNLYPDKKLLICGSPRLKNKHKKLIKDYLIPKDDFWFNTHDGVNPYQQILQSSPHIFVTSDSINMLNECAASNALVTILASDFIPTKKHQRFINSINNRWNDYDASSISFEKTGYAIEQILNNPRFQKLLNSPTSSNSG